MQFLQVPSIFKSNRWDSLKDALVNDLQDLILFVDSLKTQFDFDTMSDDIAQDFALMMGLQIVNFDYLGKNIRLGLKKYTNIEYYFGSEKVFYIISYYHRFRLKVYNIWAQRNSFTEYEKISTDILYTSDKEEFLLTSKLLLELEFYFKFENNYYLYNRNFNALEEDFNFYKIGYQIIDLRFLNRIETRTKTETRQEGNLWLVKDFDPIFESASGGASIQMDVGKKMDNGEVMDVFFPYNDILDQYTEITVGDGGSIQKTFVENPLKTFTAFYILDTVNHKWIFYGTLDKSFYHLNPINEVQLKNPTTGHVLIYCFFPKIDFVGKDIKFYFELDWYSE